MILDDIVEDIIRLERRVTTLELKNELSRYRLMLERCATLRQVSRRRNCTPAMLTKTRQRRAALLEKIRSVKERLERY